VRYLVIAASLVVSGGALLADTQDRLAESVAVFSEIMNTPDKGIPQDLLEKAECVVIIPGLKKGAIGIGGQYGRGFASCRRSTGTGWQGPAAVRMEGGSFGFQLGGSSTDVVMLVMNRRGMDKLLEDKFTLGGDAAVAAGPVGRTAAASTDAQLSAEILAYSRAKGLFAGIALSGATLRNDLDTNADMYGTKLDNKTVLTGDKPAPAAAKALMAELNRYSRHSSQDADRVVK
jgi:SH3 domain-containing YSC84-like protein 1